MKTLVIHPFDPTTEVLKQVYEGKGYTEVTNNQIARSRLYKLIQSHDRILMFGHGTETGLFGKNRLIIDSRFVQVLREKKNCVFVWCHANEFVEKYKLDGFYTGMIISEYSEALDHCVRCSSKELEEANQLLADLLKVSIDMPALEAKDFFKKKYHGNDVVSFNRCNIFATEIPTCVLE